MAEEGQTFTCQLVSVDNGGVLDPALDEARVYIPPNDKVEGVVSIDPSTRDIVAGEPVQGHNGVFVIRLVPREIHVTCIYHLRKDKKPEFWLHALCFTHFE